MRIGFDAKWFFNGNPSGRIVVINLIQKLLEINNQHEIYIILNKKDINKKFPFKHEKIKIIYIWGGINLISNVCILPMVLLKYKLDVCVFQYFAPVISNCKKIVFIHDIIFKSHPEYFTIKEKIYFSPMKYLAQRADGIITISQNEKSRINYYGFSGQKTKVCVIYNGVDGKYQPKKYLNSVELEMVKNKYSLPEHFLLYVGRLNERKNILNLLKAIKILNNKEIKLILCGKYDWKMFPLNERIEELGLKNRVTLLGHIADDDLPKLYSLATVFCYISFEEGFGLPPLEALASGVPVLVSQSSSLPEICGDAAVYCNPNEPSDISEKIDMLLYSGALREFKVNIGLNRIKKFNWEKSAKELLKFCEQI